jgi:DNA invertase Pin-like site-specific DNA recombinase
MKAVIYARVSSDSQDVELSISAQLRALREYAAKHEYEIVREFVDEAESGRTTSRPAFREMIALAKIRQTTFEAILVWKLNRFARSRVDSITYKALLKSKGIKVISINEPLDDSPSGQLLEGVIESIDEFYSANLGQDIKRGMRENAQRGFFSGSRPPYGFHKVAERMVLRPDISLNLGRRILSLGR